MTDEIKSQREVEIGALELLSAARQLAQIAMQQIKDSVHEYSIIDELNFSIDQTNGKTTIEWYNSSESC